MRLNRRTTLISALAVAATTMLTAVPALAEYPESPITFIVPYGAGGGTDISGRALATELEKILGQPVVVENVEGGGGAVGLTQLFNAAPDGYTIGVGTGSNTTIAPHAVEVGYDPLKFSYIAGYYGWTYAVLVNPSVPANNMKELAAWAKANPGALINSTSGGYGIHDVAMALFSEAAGGIEYRTLPNNSAAQTTQRILAGDANITSVRPRPTSNTSRPAARIVPDFSASISACSSTTVPRATLMITPRGPKAFMTSALMILVVLGPPGKIRTSVSTAFAISIRSG